jgi:hypothetical protein
VPTLREQVHALLAEAAELDRYACETRERAGQLLLDHGYDEAETRNRAQRELGIDARLAELLISMAGRARARAVANRPRRSYPADESHSPASLPATMLLWHG